MMGRRGWAVWAAAAIGILAWEHIGGDLWVAQRIAGAQGFVWRDHPLWRDVLHDGGRWAAAIALAAWAAWAAFARDAAHGPSREQRWRAWGMTLMLMLLVTLIKRLSLASCPWDLALFGGRAQYLSHWGVWWPGPGDGGAGHCFPSGHAVAAFAFLPGVWLWWPFNRRKALAWAAAVLVAGGLAGVTQTLRGAHFVSHSLWTAWLCGCLSAWRGSRFSEQPDKASHAPSRDPAARPGLRLAASLRGGGRRR